MKRVEFRLSMPRNNAWNGKWTGKGNNYVIYKNLTDKKVKELIEATDGDPYWTYNFGDGWIAGITLRELAKGERKQKSDGFCGYDWMVRSILTYNKICTK